MAKKKRVVEEGINVRVWKKSWLKLRVLAAKRGIKNTEMFDLLMNEI